ncbi:sushi, von Willebrand factor type A, EGF and pentraxin domain-containing protein 1-like [Panulirus ornatus]|uniref:sushi, von Willebrand factor type A, EGF and pentraxin domain-containing protein 1-like n=1 Tax=Panulirus ornatus TaxID=150431 RepID=UPI003A8B5C44
MPAWRRPTDYTMQRFYECDKGYVFAGTGKRTFMVECNSTGSWDPPEVPDCIPKRPCKAISPDCPQAHSPEVLCPDPPEEPLNGTRVVVMDVAFYTCDPGLEFPSGERQMNTTCLMGNKTWDIDVVPDCEVRRCRHDPPAPHPGMRSDWSPGRRELDTVITYHCPDNYVTWGENSTKQEVTCVHFQDKDTLIWDKEEVLVCNRESGWGYPNLLFVFLTRAPHRVSLWFPP